MTVTKQVAPDAGGRAGVLVVNALWNLVRGAASSGVAVLVPIFLLAVLPAHTYSTWALVFGMAAFVSYLDLGIPTTLQSKVAKRVAGRDMGGLRDDLAGAAVLMACLALVAILAAVGAAASLGAIFPQIPSDAVGGAGLSLVLLTVGQASNLASNAFSAFYAGQQRSNVPAVVLTPARLGSLALCIAIAFLVPSPPLIAAGFSVPLAAGTAVLYLRARAEIHVPAVVTRRRRGMRRSAVGLMVSSGPLIVWSFCVLATSGAGVVIVGRVDYQDVPLFSLAVVIVSAFIGFQSAIASPALSELASGVQHGDAQRLNLYFERVSVLMSNVLFLAAGMAVAVIPLSVSLLLHVSNPVHAFTVIVTLLIGGNLVHLVGTPLSMLFIATDSHRRIIWPPVIEAVLSVGGSLVFGYIAGAFGVAIGESIAAFAGLMLGFFWSPRLASLSFVRPRYLLGRALLRPALGAVPFFVGGLILATLDVSGAGLIFDGALCVVGAATVVFVGLGASEIGSVRNAMRSRPS